MPKHTPFERHVERDEAWFERHAAVYVSELLALRLAVPVTGRGLEIDAWTQTLVEPPNRSRDIEPVRPGCGEGAFVVVTARNAK